MLEVEVDFKSSKGFVNCSAAVCRRIFAGTPGFDVNVAPPFKGGIFDGSEQHA
jgi:hypothetical protein